MIWSNHRANTIQEVHKVMSKSFSQHAIDKINDIMKNHSNHVGSQLKESKPVKYKDFISSDCITMSIWMLKVCF